MRGTQATISGAVSFRGVWAQSDDRRWGREK